MFSSKAIGFSVITDDMGPIFSTSVSLIYRSVPQRQFKLNYG